MFCWSNGTQKGVHLLSLFYLLVVPHKTFGGVLKDLHIPLFLWLLNNLKLCFKGIESALGSFMCAPLPPVRFGLWALLLIILEEFSLDCLRISCRLSLIHI